MTDAVTQFRWDYVMESGIRALTLALALRLPGDYPLPLGSWRGISGRVSSRRRCLRWKGRRQAAAARGREESRNRFPLYVREPWALANGAEGVRKSVAGLSGHSLAAKGGNEGCLSGRLVRPGRASTFSLIDPGIGTAVGTGHHRP